MKENTEVYISLQEKDVVLLKHRGNSFTTIGTKLGIKGSEVQSIYSTANAKLHMLINEEEEQKRSFSCDTIAEFLDRLDVNNAGREQLAESIRLTYRHPQMVNNIINGLVPALAVTFECSEVLVKGRLYGAARQIFSRCRERGTPAYDFFNMAGLRSQGCIDLKGFLLASHACITELSYLQPDKHIGRKKES